MKLNGELVARLEISGEVSAEEALSMAHEHAAVKARLGQSRASRAVYVKGQMINLVTCAAETTGSQPAPSDAPAGR